MMKNKPLTFAIFILSILCFSNIFLFAQDSKYTVETLISELENNNTKLNKAKQQYVQSLLDVKDAKAGYFPTIDLQISGTYMATPVMDDIYLNVSDIVGGIPLSPSVDEVLVYEGTGHSLYKFSLTAVQPIFTWGKISNSVKLYSEISQVRYLEVTSLRDSLISELTTQLAALYYLKNIENILQQQIILANKLVTMTEEAEKNGTALRQVVLEAKLQSKELNITVNSIKEQMTYIESSIRELTGISTLQWESIEYEPTKEDWINLANSDKNSLIDIAISSTRPSIEMISRLETVSEYAKNIANASIYWKPDFALQAEVGYSNSKFPFIQEGWDSKNSYTGNFSIAIKTTVFDGGKKLNDIKRAESVVESSKYDITETIRSIQKTMEQQLNIIDVTIAKIEYCELKIETAKAKTAQQKKLTTTGYGSERELIQAQIDENTAQIELLQQYISLAQAYSKVQYLTGEK